MTRRIDLRSDAVTQPPPAMRDAMARAPVGDDVYGEDPTVNRLEAVSARRLGQESALFVPSGTMANLLALLAHCPRGHKVLAGNRSDVWLWEAGGAAVAGSLVYAPVPTKANGELGLEDLEKEFHDESDPQCAVVGAVTVENTHCLAGGLSLSLEYLERLSRFVRERGVRLHMDGSRLFNATVATGIEPAAFAAHADSVSFCLSKGLSAPVGSVLTGSADFIARARRLRKMLGGGMRQAGILAAAGLYALEHQVDRLAEDHENARRLSRSLAEIPGVRLDDGAPATNIVFFRLAHPALSATTFVRRLEDDEGVRVLELTPGRVRAVTHAGIAAAEIDAAAAAISRTIARLS